MSAFAGIFEDSFKIYSYDADKLYMTTLSALSSSKSFQITETQSKNGYILFYCCDYLEKTQLFAFENGY